VDCNLHGASFDVANMTNLVAQALKESSRPAIRKALMAQADNIVSRGTA
jgi:hypothetical protein